MAVTVNWSTGAISVPQSFMPALGGDRYELDTNELRLALKALEDDAAGIPFPDTHLHNPPITLAGVTYARQFVILNPYTVTFEDGQYTVVAVGSNHNLADVKTVNQVSMITSNSAGLIVVVAGSGVTPADKQDIADLVTGDTKTLTVGKYLTLKK